MRSLRKRLMRSPLFLRCGSLPLPSCPSGKPPSPKEGLVRSLRKRLMRSPPYKRFPLNAKIGRTIR